MKGLNEEPGWLAPGLCHVVEFIPVVIEAADQGTDRAVFGAGRDKG